MGQFDVTKVSLGFSTKLGVRQLPEFDERHASNIPGLYVVGDLADAPIIKAALNQGYVVVTGLPPPSKSEADVLDVVIVGAGPAGIGAAIAAIDRGLSYVVLERDKPFATIQNFPKAKLIFADPRDVPNHVGLWFEDARKENLITRWGQVLDDRQLHLHQPEEVVDIRKENGIFQVVTRVGGAGLLRRPESDPTTPQSAAGASNVYRARSVILATGRRAAVRRLDCPGEDLAKVAYALRDPEDHRGRRVLVVGGGDSAIEAACETAEAGAHVTLSYRGKEFVRCSAKNRKRIEAMLGAGTLKVEFGTVVTEIRKSSVLLERDGKRIDLQNDDVLVFIGTHLPTEFLDRIGIRINGRMDLRRMVGIALFALATYLFYVLKSHRYEEGNGGFFPFGPGDPLAQVPALLQVHLPLGKYFADRVVDPSFWGTVVYSVLISVFGFAAWRKYPSPEQKQRYRSLVAFQLVFLFGIPELIAPLVIDRPWKVYAATVPWPLSIWSLVDAPSWAGGSVETAAGWLGLGAFVSFVALPLYVRRNGERFCSYLCGCGGLAETFGDFWRHLAPRGPLATKAEWGGRAVLFAAIPVTGLILNDAWGFVAKDALYSTKVFAEHWYGLMVDFWLASVIGVALYPYLGNRIWCRFFCPLRAYMELVAKYISKIQIVANERCIGCGECTRFCQMGIDVQAFAQREASMHNANSACIQCGICIEVCPMGVLSVDRERQPGVDGQRRSRGLMLQ